MIQNVSRLVYSLFIICCALMIAEKSSANPAMPYAHFTLKNGMEVFVVENHKVPAVSHMLWFRIGAADDPPGKSGLAHFHEHMMFRGSNHIKPGEYSQIINRLGGEQNAFTSRDYTGYYVNVAKEHLQRVMELEAERMQNFAPPEEEYAREREVIIEERRQRVDSKPSALLDEQMDTSLMAGHPYQLPVIGLRKEMEALGSADVSALHARYYHPANALLIVVGDVAPGEIKALAEQYYGSISAGQRNIRSWAAMSPDTATQSRIVFPHSTVKQPSWVRYYRADSLRFGATRRALPLYLLAQMLGGSETGYLHRELVKKQRVATQVSVDYDGLSIGPAVLAIQALPAPGISKEALEKAMDAALAHYRKAGIDEKELARAKTVLASDVIYARDGLEPLARILGEIAVMDLDIALFYNWPQDIVAVSAQAVQQAAQTTLESKHAVTGWLVPQEAKKP